MQLSTIKLKNFRNFIDESFLLNEKSLVIGSNDVGKTNLIDAIRLLLDKSLSEEDIEPAMEDFCAMSSCDTFEVTLHFTQVFEDCIKSKFPGYISEEDELYLKYIAYKDGKRYSIYAGPSDTEEYLEEIKGRFYLKVLNLKYVSATRQIDSFLKNQKNKLLEKLKSVRTIEQIDTDDKQMNIVVKHLATVQDDLEKLSFIDSAGTLLNTELAKLAEHHAYQQIRLGVDIPKSNDLFRKIQLLSNINDQAIQLGGDGKKNQAFLALWAALNEVEKGEDEPNEVSIFCIEEPEAHLHPHQQRRLSEYLVNDLDSQVILTSHSPYIASEFNPDSIIRLYTNSETQSTSAAKKGVSLDIFQKVKSLEFRLNVISAEVYFSDCVFLVEGSSEVIFYKALAAALEIELDRLNISILSIEGVGFDRYIELFSTLEIPWVSRTDNDYQKVSAKVKGDFYRLSGIQRAAKTLILKSQLKSSSVEQSTIEEINQKMNQLTNIPAKNLVLQKQMLEDFSALLEPNGIFLAELGLEEDLFYSGDSIQHALKEFYRDEEDLTNDDIIKKMKNKKSTQMYYFVSEHFDVLSDLSNNKIALPLLHCKKIVEELRRV